jgi:nucleoside-diphosphate-sugar epimerase
MSNIYGITGTHIFITGGAGFIGSTLASRLAEDNRITLYDNLHNDALKNTALVGHPNVELVQGDVLDSERLARTMAPSVEYVVHCAAIAGVDTVLKNPLRTLEVNLLGVFRVLEAATRLPKLRRLVDFSTSEVFGQRAYKVGEQVVNPSVTIGEARWTYSISKLAGEFVTHAYHQSHGLPTVTVRPFNVYGPNQVGVGAIHHFVRRALRNEDLVIHNDGSQIRAWCYVDDFVHGVLLTLARPEAVGKCYNIGNPRSVLTTYNLARAIVSTAGSSSQLVFRTVTYPDVDIRVPDINAARQDLGYEPEVDVEEGIRRTIEWYRSRELAGPLRKSA